MQFGLTDDRLFAAHMLEEMLAAPTEDGGEWATTQHAIIAAKSPLSCKVAVRELAASRRLIDFAADADGIASPFTSASVPTSAKAFGR